MPYNPVTLCRDLCNVGLVYIIWLYIHDALRCENIY
jgi:hypothetical protein